MSEVRRKRGSQELGMSGFPTESDVDGSIEEVGDTKEKRTSADSVEDQLVFKICGKDISLGGLHKKKRRRMSLESLRSMAYKQRLTQLCKGNDMVGALEVYDEIKSNSINRDQLTYQMIIALCGGSPGDKDGLDPGNGFNAATAAVIAKKNGAGEAGVSSADYPPAGSAVSAEITESSAQCNRTIAADAAVQIFADAAAEKGVHLQESAYTGVIRACCLDGRVDEAMKVLQQLKEAGEAPRLRSYTPLLEGLCNQGRREECEAMWMDAVAQGVTMTEREYLSLVQVCTTSGDEACFLRVMESYMEDVLEPRSRHSWDVLRTWFSSGLNSSVTGDGPLPQGREEIRGPAIGRGEAPSEPLPADASADVTSRSPGVPELAKEAGNDSGSGARGLGGVGGEHERWRMSECTVKEDGACRGCGEVLQSIELSKEDVERLLAQVEELVCTSDERVRQFAGFKGWLSERGRGSYHVIIDGANVGYYKQNPGNERGNLADLRQVDWVVRKYEAEGKKVLVILHSRHLTEKRLPEKSKKILKRWRASKAIQSCAPRNNDDWYWLYAAAFIGGRVLVVTNDEMRDHHFSMLSHRSFQRWKERHQTRFTFGEWVQGDDCREVFVEEPTTYSKRIQRSEKAWHFPLQDSDQWLCCVDTKA